MFLPFPASYLPTGPLQPKSESLRVVDRFFIGRDALTAEELLAQVVDSDTKYLVLDLDKTIHRKRNMGELLGWELNAYRSYGQHYQELSQRRYRNKKLVFLWHHPWGLLKYIWRGLRLWAYPGLYYLFYAKLFFKNPFSRAWVYRRFGPDPVAMIQDFPRQVLLHEISSVSKATLRILSENLWLRFADQQVFERRHFEALKQQYPGLRTVLSSASPEVVLQVAQEKLAVDHIHYTAIEASDAYYYPPLSFLRSLYRFWRPSMFARPESLEANASLHKVQKLSEAFDDFLDPKTIKVGITDTSHGEDFYWTTVFTKLVDVNSPQPFSPIVVQESPLQDLISCRLITAKEAQQAFARQPCSEFKSRFLRLQRSDLEHLLAVIIKRCQMNYSQYVHAFFALRPELDRWIFEGQALQQQVSRLVCCYNRASHPSHKERYFSELSKALHREQQAYQRLLMRMRPLSEERRRYLDELIEARRNLSKLA